MKKLKNTLTSYFERTTLHGFIYISTSKNLAEKIFWILALLSSLICCLLFFYELIIKVQSNPIVVYRPDIAVGIKNIPFPAISFCSLPVLNDTYQIFSSVLKTNNASYPFDIKTCNDKFNCNKVYYNWRNLRLYMQNILHIEGTWIDKIEIKAQNTISQYGWCRTFNLVEENHLLYKNQTAEYFGEFRSMDYENDFHIKENFLNHGRFTTKKERGFHGVIEQSINKHLLQGCTFSAALKKICISSEKQTRVVIHSPYELVDSRHRTFIMSNLGIYKIAVVPSIKITDETLLGLDVDERRCYKNDERQLKFFRNYTTINCLKECEADFLLQKCGCVPYYLINNDTSLICTHTKIDCFESQHEEFMVRHEPFCKCYLPCEDTNYNIIIKRLSSSLKKNSGFNSKNEIRVNFKDDSVYPQIRRKYFTMIDWFSFVGGILGLFFGFSFLSGFEIIFHILKGCYDIRRKKSLRAKNIWMSNSRMMKSVKNIRKYLENFLKNSSVHGFGYIGDDDLKIMERLSWTISFILSITACAFMILELRQKWKINSISFVTSETYLNMTEIPFPAVTIEGEYRQRNIGQIASDLGLKDDTKYPDYEEIFEDNKFQFDFILQSLAKNDPRGAMKFMRKNPHLAYFNFQHNLTDYGHKIVEAISEWSDVSFASNLEVKWIQNVAVPRAKIFIYNGNALSFNMVDSWILLRHENISSDFCYNHTSYFKGGVNTKYSKAPWTPIYTNDDLFTISFENSYTKLPKVILHTPYEYPFSYQMEADNIFELRQKGTIEVVISPEIITTDDDLRNLSPNERNCLMENEKKLKFFKIYTKKNCEIECLSEKLFSSCGCVPYDVIRDKNVKICELFDYICVQKMKAELLEHDDPQMFCNCLQPCNYIGYNFEFIETPHRESNEGIVKFRFKENEFVSMQRIRQFTVVDFLSYIGGLLGLFAGISVLSLFEIFYFFTLRFICEIWIMKRESKRVGISIMVAPKNLMN